MKRLVSIMAVIASIGVGSLAYAGTPGGPKSDQYVVGGYGAVPYEVVFNGGEFAQVRVHSYGSTFVELIVCDAYGNVVATANDYSGDAIATWFVPGTAMYRIVVSNPSSNGNSYFVSTN